MDGKGKGGEVLNSDDERGDQMRYGEVIRKPKIYVHVHAYFNNTIIEKQTDKSPTYRVHYFQLSKTVACCSF